MSDVTVNVRDNGPIVIEGPVTVVDGEGNKFVLDDAKPAIALCRCGESQNKPFCDGAHRSCSFESAVRST